MQFDVHVCSWLPYARIDNLLWGLPDRDRRGPRAAGPYLRGDGFVIPPATADTMRGHTLRAWQHLTLPAHRWGDALPLGPVDVCTGMMQVLAADGSTPVHSEQGLVTHSLGRVGFNQHLDGYEIDLQGEATVPVLVEAAQASAAGEAQAAPEANRDEPPTPVLGWKLHLCIQKGPPAVRAGSVSGCDESARFYPGTLGLGGSGGNAVYGSIAVRLFASYVVYVSVTRAGGRRSVPLFFANGFGRSITGILSWQESPLRTVTW